MVTRIQNEYLEKLLNKIISFSQNQVDIPKKLNRFIHYTTVATIYEKIRKDPMSSVEDKKAAIGNREKFEKNIKPEIDTFINQEIQQHKGKILAIFNTQMNDYITQIETNFSTLPQIAMEICDEAGSYLKIYRKAVQNQTIFHNFERIVSQKKVQLKHLFEIEAGQKILPNLEDSLSTVEVNTSPGEPTAVAEEIISSDIILPETPTTPPELSIVSPTISPVESVSVDVQKIDVSPVQYTFSQWFPSQWGNFISLRYCHECGYLIHPTSRICTGCQHSYQ